VCQRVVRCWGGGIDEGFVVREWDVGVICDCGDAAQGGFWMSIWVME
jgi:hypothetical protein